jgi:ABC-type multidrug transport system fused ATPase/permease subunit
MIDGMPLHRIKRAKLRQSLIAIPQDAAFLPGANGIKLNIDPFEDATESECLSVLRLVGLSEFVEVRGGIQANMSADDLSAGQRQLFCLGRAIVRKRVRSRAASGNGDGGILLLDEASSNIDHDSDKRIQSIIHDEFKSYTIIAVSHRLDAVVDYFDTVVVMERGKIIELGRPRALLETPGSQFGTLWAKGNNALPSAAPKSYTDSYSDVGEGN